MAYPSPRPSQDDQEPLLQLWRSMARPNVTSTNSTGDLPSVGKTEDPIATSASSSDVEVHKSGFRGKDRGNATFAQKGLAKDHYRPVESYEGFHRYDPDFEWEPEEEKKVVRKVRDLPDYCKSTN